MIRIKRTDGIRPGFPEKIDFCGVYGRYQSLSHIRKVGSFVHLSMYKFLCYRLVLGKNEDFENSRQLPGPDCLLSSFFGFMFTPLFQQRRKLDNLGQTQPMSNWSSFILSRSIIRGPTSVSVKFSICVLWI